MHHNAVQTRAPFSPIWRQVRNTERGTTSTSVVPTDQHTLPRSYRQHFPSWNHGRQGLNTRMLRLLGPRCDRGPLTGITHYSIPSPVDIPHVEQPHVCRRDICHTFLDIMLAHSRGADSHASSPWCPFCTFLLFSWYAFGSLSGSAPYESLYKFTSYLCTWLMASPFGVPFVLHSRCVLKIYLLIIKIY